eukprot:4863057-Amphidinium_carterae.1
MGVVTRRRQLGKLWHGGTQCLLLVRCSQPAHVKPTHKKPKQKAKQPEQQATQPDKRVRFQADVPVPVTHAN